MQGSLEKANKSDSLITTLAIRKPAGEVKKSNKKVLDEEEYVEVIMKTKPLFFFFFLRTLPAVVG